MLILRVKIETKRWRAKVCGARIQLPRFDSQSGVKLPIEEHVAVDELARGGWEVSRERGRYSWRRDIFANKPRGVWQRCREICNLGASRYPTGRDSRQHNRRNR
ncbi:unnamed protein product [Arctia plantaginis]|uniref:Uncharacterized protein n=1 Tax=Arctia plantaginis TaxID=874455 RepID=A0A8S0Z6Y7_ARCPL|nr:unnamed protein product [Arctia plantaginis]